MKASSKILEHYVTPDPEQLPGLLIEAIPDADSNDWRGAVSSFVKMADDQVIYLCSHVTDDTFITRREAMEHAVKLHKWITSQY